MVYQIEISPTAVADIESIFTWWCEVEFIKALKDLFRARRSCKIWRGAIGFCNKSDHVVAGYARSHFRLETKYNRVNEKLM